MARYLEGKDPNDDFIDDPNVVQRAYCRQTGKLAGDKCSQDDIRMGYYDINNLPQTCDGNHPNSSSSDLNSSQVSSIPQLVDSIGDSVGDSLQLGDPVVFRGTGFSEEPSSVPSSSEASSSEGTSSEPESSIDPGP